MIFTINELTFLSPDKAYEKEELEIILKTELVEVKSIHYYHTDYTQSFIELLKEKHSIYAVFCEVFEKQPVHFDLEFSLSPSNADQDDLPF